MILTNYHSHSRYCDGQGEIRDYAIAAIAQGMASIGFSGHSPVPFASDWNMTKDDYPAYLKDCYDVKKEFQNQIEIYTGLETDFIEGVQGSCSFPEVDYTVGSVHYFKTPDGQYWSFDYTAEDFRQGLKQYFNNDIKKLVKTYYQNLRLMVQLSPPDIIGHLDLVKKFNKGDQFFNENESWYRDEVLASLDAITQTDCIVEVNYRGVLKKLTDDFFPARWILKACYERQIPLTISADAHKANELTALHSQVARHLNAIGYDSIKVLKDSTWQYLDL